MKTTLNEIRQYEPQIREKFKRYDTIAFENVSQTQLSVARYFGVAKVNNHTFVYNPDDDSLIRDDVLAFVNKLKRQKQKPREEKHDDQLEIRLAADI